MILLIHMLERLLFRKKIILERIFGFIAQFAPFFLRNEIIKRSTNLSWVWQRIRRHFNFVQSEVNLLNLANISQKPDDLYEILSGQFIKGRFWSTPCRLPLKYWQFIYGFY